MTPGQTSRFGFAPPTSTGGARGFTLIEVILALGIFSIVLVAINTAFFAALRLRERTSEAVNGSMPVNRALSLLRRDLQNAVAPGGLMAGDFRTGATGGGVTGFSANSSTRTTSGATVTSGATPSSLGMAQYGGLDFFTSTGTLSDDLPWGDIQEVNYRLVEPLDKGNALGKDLVRSVNRNLLSLAAEAPEEQRLVGNIEDLEILCYDGTQWRETWDTSAGDSGLPSAVRVRLHLATDKALTTVRQEPLEMVVLLESQSRTNQTQTSGG